MQKVYFKSEKQKRRFMKDWYSKRPLHERIRRIGTKLIYSSNKDIYLEIDLLKELNLSSNSSNTFLNILNSQFDKNLSYEDKLILASVKGIKSILSNSISIKEKIRIISSVFKNFSSENQRNKLITEINMKFNQKEKRIVDYVLKKLNS